MQANNNNDFIDFYSKLFQRVITSDETPIDTSSLTISYDQNDMNISNSNFQSQINSNSISTNYINFMLQNTNPNYSFKSGELYINDFVNQYNPLIKIQTDKSSYLINNMYPINDWGSGGMLLYIDAPSYASTYNNAVFNTNQLFYQFANANKIVNNWLLNDEIVPSNAPTGTPVPTSASSLYVYINDTTDSSTNPCIIPFGSKFTFQYLAMRTSQIQKYNQFLSYSTTYDSNQNKFTSTVNEKTVSVDNSYVLKLVYVPYDTLNYEMSNSTYKTFSVQPANDFGSFTIDAATSYMNTNANVYKENGIIVVRYKDIANLYTLTIDEIVTYGSNVPTEYVDPSNGQTVNLQNGSITLFVHYLTDGQISNTTNVNPDATCRQYISLDQYNPIGLPYLTANINPNMIFGTLVPSTTNYNPINSDPIQVRVNPSLYLYINDENTDIQNHPGSFETVQNEYTVPVNITYVLETGWDTSMGFNVNTTLVFTFTGQNKGKVFTHTHTTTSNTYTFSTVAVASDQNGILLCNELTKDTYTLTCSATFPDQQFADVIQNIERQIQINSIGYHYNMFIDYTNVIYKNMPTLTFDFGQNQVFGCNFIVTVQSTNRVNQSYGPYTITDTTYTNDNKTTSYTFTFPDTFIVGNYVISVIMNSDSYGSGVSGNNTMTGTTYLYFVVSKASTTLNSINANYIVGLSDTISIPVSLSTNVFSSFYRGSINMVCVDTNHKQTFTYLDNVVNNSIRGITLSTSVQNMTGSSSSTAGSYEVMIYFSDNDNYNATNQIYTNITVKNIISTGLSITSTHDNVNFNTILTIPSISGDNVSVYNTLGDMANIDPIITYKCSGSTLYTLSDSLLVTGVNALTIVVENPNNTKYGTISITKSQIGTSITSTLSGSFVYGNVITVNSTVTANDSSTIMEGYVVHSMTQNGVSTILGKTVVVDGATSFDFTLECIAGVAGYEKITITSNYLDGVSYSTSSFTSSSYSVAKETLANPTLSKDDKAFFLQETVVSFTLGDSNINYGYVTFVDTVSNTTLFDNIPILNGVAQIKLLLLNSSYNIQARTTLIGTPDISKYNDATSTLSITVTKDNINNNYSIDSSSESYQGFLTITATLSTTNNFSSLLLNTGSVEFTMGTTPVTLNVDIVDGVAIATFVDDGSKPTIVYSNSYYTGVINGGQSKLYLDGSTVITWPGKTITFNSKNYTGRITVSFGQWNAFNWGGPLVAFIDYQYVQPGDSISWTMPLNNDPAVSDGQMNIYTYGVPMYNQPDYLVRFNQNSTISGFTSNNYISPDNFYFTYQ